MQQMSCSVFTVIKTGNTCFNEQDVMYVLINQRSPIDSTLFYLKLQS